MLILMIMPVSGNSELMASIAPADSTQAKKVFVLNSFNRGYIWTDNMLRGIDDTFNHSRLDLDVYTRFMDMKRIPPTPQYYLRLKEMIQEGYKNVKFDAILLAIMMLWSLLNYIVMNCFLVCRLFFPRLMIIMKRCWMAETTSPAPVKTLITREPSGLRYNYFPTRKISLW